MMMTYGYVYVAQVAMGANQTQYFKALKEAEANIKGMVAIFTYGFPVSKERFEAANLDVFTLSNYENLLQKAVDKQYVSENELETLSAWNANPAEWNVEI